MKDSIRGFYTTPAVSAQSCTCKSFTRRNEGVQGGRRSLKCGLLVTISDSKVWRRRVRAAVDGRRNRFSSLGGCAVHELLAGLFGAFEI